MARTRDANGNDIAKRFDSESEAKDWLRKLKAQMVLGSYQSPTKITLEQWIVDYLMTYKAKSVRPKTMIRYFETAKHLSPIANLFLEDVTTHKLQQFFNKQTAMSWSSLMKLKRLITAALEKAVVTDAITKNPMLGVEMPKVAEPKKILAFNDNEIECLLTALNNGKHNRIIPAVHLALFCGLRLGEVLGLRNSDIDRNNNTITINNSLQAIGGKLIDSQPKTKSSCRTIYAPSELIQKLPVTDGYIFATANGTAISPTNFRKYWQRLLKDAELPADKHFHSLRHTHATKLIAAGVPIPNVSRRLGHSNITTTLNTYVHSDDSAEKLLQKVVTSMVITKP